MFHSMLRKAAPFILVLLFVPLIFQSCGSLEVIQGEDVSYLKGEDEVAVEFTYNGTKVGEQDEEEFVQEKVEEKDDGEDWREEWHSNKENYYHSTFRSQLEDYFDDTETNIDLTEDKEDANYLIRVNVDRMETGFYGGVVSSPAVLDTRLFIQKIGSDGDPKTILKVEDATSGEEMSSRERLKGAYRASAMHYGRWFRGEFE